MHWEHKCSLEWLSKRNNYLTATDIKDLIPLTKSGRPRDVTDEQYLSVLARKMKYITEDDCISTGAAARGHILEPYAIDYFNSQASEKYKVTLFHWDDIILPEHDLEIVAFSPDACDIVPINNKAVQFLPNPRVIGEVKCYAPSKHLTLGFTPKEELEERWQIATAMVCKPTIERALLLLYNPSMNVQLFVKQYERADLEHEMEIISEVVERWDNFIIERYQKLEDDLKDEVFMGSMKDEARIIIKEAEKKSVIQR